jgi:hypothetical protein
MLSASPQKLPVAAQENLARLLGLTRDKLQYVSCAQRMKQRGHSSPVDSAGGNMLGHVLQRFKTTCQAGTSVCDEALKVAFSLLEHKTKVLVFVRYIREQEYIKDKVNERCGNGSCVLVNSQTNAEDVDRSRAVEAFRTGDICKVLVLGVGCAQGLDIDVAPSYRSACLAVDILNEDLQLQCVSRALRTYTQQDVFALFLFSSARAANCLGQPCFSQDFIQRVLEYPQEDKK